MGRVHGAHRPALQQLQRTRGGTRVPPRRLHLCDSIDPVPAALLAGLCSLTPTATTRAPSGGGGAVGYSTSSCELAGIASRATGVLFWLHCRLASVWLYRRLARSGCRSA